MRHRKKNKILDRYKSHRKALLINLAKSFFTYEQIRTTKAKAQFVKPYIEKIITLGKKNTLHSRREIIRKTGSNKIAKKILDTISPKYASRKGGYTRIIRLNKRKGDGADMVQIELV